MKMKGILCLLIFMPLFGYAQISRDSLFNSERTMDRRFTLYKGQIRAEGTYEFAAFKSEYDENGNKATLSEKGISSNQHAFNANIRYGIIDYLDIEARFKHKNNNYRGEPVYIISPPAPSLQLFTDVTTKGFEDIYIGINGMAPIPSNKFDLGGTFGIYLPTADSEPDQPEHSFSTDDLGEVINYYYHENWGYGVSSLYYKGFIKYRINDFAIAGFYESRVPNGESDNLTWTSRVNDNNIFEYTSVPYQYQVAQKTHLNLQMELQLYNWVNVFLGYSQFKSSGGWTAESGNKVATPEEKLSVINPGYEVLVSQKIWLRQGLNLPLSGENIIAPFSIYITIYYNLFIN
jgi:hypothetical protein